MLLEYDAGNISRNEGSIMMNRMMKADAAFAARAAEGARAVRRAAKDLSGGSSGLSAI